MKKQLLFAVALLSAQSTLPVSGAVIAWYMGPYTKSANDINDMPNNPKSIPAEDIYKVRCVNDEKITVTLPNGDEAEDVSVICKQCKVPQGRCRVDFRNVDFGDKEHKHFIAKQGKKIQRLRIVPTAKKSKKNKKDEDSESN